MIAYIYQQASMLSPPQIPRLFGDNPERFSTLEHTLMAATHLSLIQYSAMSARQTAQHNLTVERASDLYNKLISWHAALPQALQARHNFRPQTCFLRSVPYC
jgi:hypothetical protein